MCTSGSEVGFHDDGVDLVEVVQRAVGTREVHQVVDRHVALLRQPLQVLRSPDLQVHLLHDDTELLPPVVLHQGDHGLCRVRARGLRSGERREYVFIGHDWIIAFL